MNKKDSKYQYYNDTHDYQENLTGSAPGVFSINSSYFSTLLGVVKKVFLV